MLNIQAVPISFEGKEYGLYWQDFGNFRRLTIYLNDKRIGWRNLPIGVDCSDNTVRYLIKTLLVERRKLILGA